MSRDVMQITGETKMTRWLRVQLHSYSLSVMIMFKIS